MLYHSLKNKKDLVSFEEAVLNGLSPDGDLYVPQYIPKLESFFLKKEIFNQDIYSIAMEVISCYIGKSIPKKYIYNIVNQTLKIPFPLKMLHEKVYSLELFHGPTLAFKDIGVKFMSECLDFFSKKIGKIITILVATSGDTGAAVARGFYKKLGIEVIILYPRNNISNLQKKQITTLGSNILALEIDGNFDDCQNIVKKSFLDKEIKKKYILTSANSINIARWLPQMLYYFFAYKKIKEKEDNNMDLIFSVPSGNFGNICAGMMAEKMGLPIKFFIASTNINDTIPRFLSSNKFIPMCTKKTISNAMDISNPSNFPRIWNFLYKKDFYQLKKKLYSYKFTDEQTLSSIDMVWKKYKYILDPHGAIGYSGIIHHFKKNDRILYNSIFLETAHPIKFKEIMPFHIQKNINIPKKLEKFLELKGKIKNISLNNNFYQFKNWLLEKK
ncbi:threonine synthase [Blattabacterium cuenoti]|uniref:threonine synthase n=1 Tax=Blattabacterium cuenoti TaxID=1653831 RepID=UPI00163C8250|nr:threonine synthase [Blattabacterium cuenoti]